MDRAEQQFWITFITRKYGHRHKKTHYCLGHNLSYEVSAFVSHGLIVSNGIFVILYYHFELRSYVLEIVFTKNPIPILLFSTIVKIYGQFTVKHMLMYTDYPKCKPVNMFFFPIPNQTETSYYINSVDVQIDLKIFSTEIIKFGFLLFRICMYLTKKKKTFNRKHVYCTCRKKLYHILFNQFVRNFFLFEITLLQNHNANFRWLKIKSCSLNSFLLHVYTVYMCFALEADFALQITFHRILSTHLF